MSDVEVRPLAESEYRSAHDLFVASLLHPGRTSDERWQRSSARYEPGRVFGAFLDGELSGTAMSLPSSLVIPGGAELPAAAVTGVGVRPDRTRRGLLREMMRAQLADTKRRGEPVAVLHASEAPIYERFGYGIASRSQRVALRRQRATMRPDAPGDRRVRLVDGATAEKLLPEVYSRIGAQRPGMISRSEGWWATRLSDSVEKGGELVAAVHTGDDGSDDGFALYRPAKADHFFGDGSITVQVVELHAVGPVAEASLWRFLLELDLATEVVAVDRPVDEPLPWWLVDWRACEVDRLGDDLWVRLVDVAAALEAREYAAAQPVVFEVRDATLPENSGTYRIAPDGAGPAGAQRPQLTCDVEALASVFLGDVTVSTLAAANRVEVHDPAAPPEADRLFGTGRPPWCGTQF